VHDVARLFNYSLINENSEMNRRKFIKQASCAALGSSTLLSTLANLYMTNALANSSSASCSDYKALVCILLAGGNDSFNMLVPRSNSEYGHYSTTRSSLALPQNDLLNINPITPDGADYGLNPSMGGLQALFENENLAFISNVGTLVEPLANEQEYYSGLKNIPLGLYSHSDQIQQWQTSVPQSREAVGWGGKLADIMQSLNSQQDISMNISLSGRNVFQSGNTILEYAINNYGNGAEGIDKIKYYDNEGFLNLIRANAVDSLMSDVYSNVFQHTFASQTASAIEAQQTFNSAIGNVPEFATTFSDHYLSQDMRMIAKVIAARAQLGMCRQTFFVTIGGWDHHDEVLNSQAYLLGMVNDAMSEFYTVLQEIQMENNVTTFTVSDFGRTLTSNGNGSDHAWGGNQMVMGGAVNGKEIYGSYPDLFLTSNPLNVSDRGVLIPTISTDELFAELALWFGLSPSDLSLLFPNISNFYTPGSSNFPLGFLE
jgi:uncharacterized protein (DUF1501 family)